MLKKTGLLFILTFCLYSLTFAQKEFKRYSEFGIKVGTYPLNHQLNDPKGGGDEISFLGTAFGLRFVHMEEKHFGVAIEANYNVQKYNKDNKSLKATAIEIPMLSQFTFGIGKANTSINLGPYVTSYLSKPDEIVLDKNFLYGITGGLGFEFPIKNIILGLEGRYYFTFPVNSDDYQGAIRSKWAELCLSISFRKHYNN